MDHDECTLSTSSCHLAHTHEGQAGFWLFPGETHEGHEQAGQGRCDPAGAVPDPALPSHLGRRASVTIDKLSWELNQAGVSQALLTRMAQLGTDIRAELAALIPAATDVPAAADGG